MEEENMSRGPRETYGRRRVPFYRDRDNGWIFGVCAGIAEYYDINVVVIRILAALSLCLLFWPTAIAYLAATVLFRDRPLIYRGRRREEDFWRYSARDDSWSHR